MTSIINELRNANIESAARMLLGCIIIREVQGKILSGRIVETEGYHQNDAASHSFQRRSAITEVMFGKAGYAYVYFTYGMHYCFNIVTGPQEKGEVVLVRALEPINGVKEMQKYRNSPVLQLTNGPAKLCQSLRIDSSLSGHYLRNKPLILKSGLLKKNEKVIKTTRIGITRAKEELLRFYIENNPYVSRFLFHQVSSK